jgi:hypothetical protein
VLWLAGVSSAHANAATDWLLSQSNPDGSFAAESDIATPYQATAEAVRALRALGRGAGLAAADGFIAAESYAGTEYLARRILARAEAGVLEQSSIAELLSHQNPDGGFGELAGFDSTILDTAFALEALAAAGQSPTQAAGHGVGYLLDRQRADGGWNGTGAEPSVYFTTLAMRALWSHRKVFAVAGAVGQAKEYLLAQRNSRHLWAEPHESALALLGILPTLTDSTVLQDSASALRSQQLPVGSWADDVYTTALALRALTLADAPPTAPANPDLASVQAIVVDGQTGLPLSGVLVTLDGATNRSLVTSSDGLARFTELPTPGQYAVEFVLADYGTVMTVTTASTGGLIDFGAIQLTKQATATTGTIKGVVTDSSASQPLPDVLIAASTGQSTVSDGNGLYQISGVPAGSVTLTGTKGGYSSASATAMLPAGGILIFSPALTSVTEPITALQGVVTDAVTAEPLEGARVSLSGATTASSTTGPDGRYRIEGLNPGATTILIALSGYDATTAAATVQTNSITTFSPRLYLQNTAPPDANTGHRRGTGCNH